MAHASGLHFTLTLAGADDLDLAVLDFTLDEALSAPFRLTLQVASRDGELSAEAFLDREASLTVWQDGEPLRRVHGLVSEFARGDRGHRRTLYHLEVRPALWRLGLRHNARIFQRVSPLTIINTLCEERGLTDVAFAVTREPEEREYCVQYRESDLAFIQRLAAEEGLCFFHEFEDAEGGTHRLVFADDPQVLGGLGPRPYHGRAGGTPPRRHLRRLKQVARVAPASAVLKDYSFKQPAYSQLHEHAADGLDAHAQRGVVDRGYEHYDYPGRYKADASGTAFTRIRLEALRRQALTAEAESDLPELAPGTRFTLEGHDLEETNRDWQVVAAVHSGSQPQALEEEAAQADGLTRYANDLVLAPADRAWRPEPPIRPRVDGPQVAFVVGPEGEEIHCDEHGRVKVQFPWDRYAAPDTAGAGGAAAERGASAWLRVSQGWAGGGYGAMAIPRIGHEVIVSFLEGDPDQPLITGRTYHAVNTPPYALPEHKTRTVLRTQSHQGEGFNELRFEDQADQEQIWLHAQKDLELLTNNDRTEAIGHDSFLRVANDRLAEIDNDDHHRVHGNRHEQSDGNQHLIVQGSLHVRAGQAWLSECGRELHIKAGHKVVLEAGSELTLNAGGSFLKLDGGGVTLAGPSVKINAGGSPGSGSGQAAEAPLLPGHAVTETHTRVAGIAQDALLTTRLKVPEVCEACWKKAVEEGQYAIAEDNA
ncbi:type VI secretion system Vgr family protein [Halomonas sp. 328]|uniref:type VI secretion system Vgr family protein n=1 Tax=Halomonas sp. 328 TaxID=2776704 RepID=UPI0018A70747|nr:type VI secretion system tip protein TssI/VgrG [Halomonas sp. 328]MBF8223787.1 type VI secretion system tip protein VgrG [Halomonas sp. 328]